jgi:phage regulator Rha-like protein
VSNHLALVETRGQSALTTSLIVAEGCEISHKRAMALFRQHEDYFLMFGRVLTEKHPFDTEGGTQEREVAVLNEDQATFLITMFRNTPVVVKFKVRLVLEFRKALNEIARLYANPPRADLLKAKRAAHLPMMDALVECREEAGKDTKTHHFTNENRLCNWVVIGCFDAIDEKTLGNEDAALLEQVRDRNRAYILAGLDYEARKPKLMAFATRVRTKLLRG